MQLETKNGSVWELDSEHSSVEFTVKKLWFMSVSGRITGVSGSIMLDESSVDGSSVAASIKAATIETRNKQRDAQVRSAFLAVDKYPAIRFESREVAKGRDRDMLRVVGALTIRDKCRDVVLDVTEVDRSRSPNGEEVIYYVAETELNRLEFGVNAWRGVVGQKVRVVINVQANRVT